MKRVRLITLVAGIALLGMSGLSKATPMIATWEAIVTSTIVDSLSLPSQFLYYHYQYELITWNTIFDDEGTEYHTYNDGDDGVAGSADDTLRSTYDMSILAPMFNYFSNVQFEFTRINK